MKIILVFTLFCAFVAAASTATVPHVVEENALIPNVPLAIDKDNASRNILVNILVRQLFEYIRYVIKNGSIIFGTPPLDPLYIEELALKVPAGLLNLDLELQRIAASGVGDFVVHKSDLSLRRLTFDLDISVPRLEISSDVYDLVGDILTAIPLYGTGNARFIIEDFRLQSKLYLKQSDDGKSVLIDRIENPAFQLPSFQSQLTGVIGGGEDVDAIVNAITEDVIIGYVNRFQGAISKIASLAIIAVANPILDQLDTWKFLAPLMPS
ncbi:uncharacterized protein LOC131844523 [Achroia grisella]|uniref:uncharacterized protein LOC131844523 n=1 Tax=Achroia grisella TaxID=688607 RepID=UPI0027D2FDB5|nr:uncharacterized protein LOC131844523 [Achroia grisella]